VSKPDTLKDNNKATLSEFMEEIWNKGNLDKADKFIQVPYVIHHDPGDPWEGQSLDLPTFKKRVLQSQNIFPDLHFTVKEVVGEGDKVAISWELQGTHKGNIEGLPPVTGKKVKVSGLTIYYFSNGKITGHWQVVDRLGFMQQLAPKANQ
jgi:steroid delta-isomerase-like uncharacterized protein